MDAALTSTHQELGRRLTQVREAAGLKQAELARQITWSPAVLSRVESGVRELSPDELKTVMEAIGTPEALHLSTAISREWLEIQRPPLDHPDQDLLWDAEQICRSLVALSRDPKVRHVFEQRLTEYINGIKQGAELLLERNYHVALIGSKGIGKSTAICKVTRLEVQGPDNATLIPVLEAGGGGVTICDVHLGTGQGFGLVIEPCSEEEIRAHVTDFAEHVKGIAANAEDETEESGQGIAQEIERAIRNLAGLKVGRNKGPDGKTIRRDEAKELAERTGSVREYVFEVLARMELHRRDRRDIWHDPATGKTPLGWLKDTFEQVNNGRHADFTLPNRIEIIVPQPMLEKTDLSIRFIDTRGIDRTAVRADLEQRLDEPHTLALLCSGFNDAPSATAYFLLERARQAGVRRLERNTALLVLPRPNEALAVKDEGGVRAQTVEDGYALKSEFAEMALAPLRLSDLRIGFFNAFADDPVRLRSLIFDSLLEIRDGFRTRLREDLASARLLLANHEKEQVREVLRSAAAMLRAWVTKHSNVPPLGGQVRDSLLSQIRSAYASTVRATIRREGEWPNLDYGHHLGYGARRLAAIALEPAVERFKGVSGVMEGNPEYAEAKDLIQQAQRVLESAFEDLLRMVQLMGRTAFKDALKHDRSLWVQCAGEWSRGSGYRDRVTDRNEQWFNATARKEIERELFELIDREWRVLLRRLSLLLQVDEAETGSAVVR